MKPCCALSQDYILQERLHQSSMMVKTIVPLPTNLSFSYVGSFIVNHTVASPSQTYKSGILFNWLLL